MIIAISGCDGAGKTTVTRLLSKLLTTQGLRVTHVDKWDVYDFDRHPECRFLTTSLQTLRRCISEMHVPARTLFLFWTIHTTITRVRPADCDAVLIDSYWTKHAASEILYGAPPLLVESLATSLPLPDLVYYLDIPPAIAWARKAENDFSDVVPYECGMQNLSEANFVAHQSKLRDILLGWSRDFGWINLDGTRMPEEIAAEIARGVVVACKTKANT